MICGREVAVSNEAGYSAVVVEVDVGETIKVVRAVAQLVRTVSPG
jgi:hypothetical protein